jgi:predicted enzyme related to lactoylglutathione lyase
MDYKIELIPISVTDVDRTKAFYEDVVGWPADQDQVVEEAGLRFVQITPPGSACSFCFVKGMEMLGDGVTQYLQLVVDDADAAYAELKGRGVEVTEVEELPWGRFTHFEDPDGNHFALQELPDYAAGLAAREAATASGADGASTG